MVPDIFKPASKKDKVQCEIFPLNKGRTLSGTEWKEGQI